MSTTLTSTTTRDSLVKYDPPSVVKGKNTSLTKSSRLEATSAPSQDVLLNAIVPPKKYNMPDGSLWVQSISGAQATRSDVIKLQEALDRRLQQRQARETGICPIREELYSQCFDELIRQITLNCTERGVLLLRVRDEIRMTLAAYQTLYESSIAFGMRKSLMAEQKKSELQAKIKIVSAEIAELEKTIETTLLKIDEVNQLEEERVKTETEAHSNEVRNLNETVSNLKETLMGLLSAQKK